MKKKKRKVTSVLTPSLQPFPKHLDKISGIFESSLCYFMVSIPYLVQKNVLFNAGVPRHPSQDALFHKCRKVCYGPGIFQTSFKFQTGVIPCLPSTQFKCSVYLKENSSLSHPLDPHIKMFCKYEPSKNHLETPPSDESFVLSLDSRCQSFTKPVSVTPLSTSPSRGSKTRQGHKRGDGTSRRMLYSRRTGPGHPFETHFLHLTLVSGVDNRIQRQTDPRRLLLVDVQRRG